MGSRKYLVLFHSVSCGQNGPNLGADEQDIVLIVYLILDITNNKVIHFVYCLPHAYMLLIVKDHFRSF